jgi:hypothetical protein
VGGATRVLSMALPQLMEQKNFLSIPFKEEKIKDDLQKTFFIIKERICGRFSTIGPAIYTSPIFGRLSDSVNSNFILKY